MIQIILAHDSFYFPFIIEHILIRAIWLCITVMSTDSKPVVSWC